MQIDKETMQIITSCLVIKVELRKIFKKELWYGEIKRRKKEKKPPCQVSYREDCSLARK